MSKAPVNSQERKQVLGTLGKINSSNKLSIKDTMAAITDLHQQIKMMKDRLYTDDQIYKFQTAALVGIRKGLLEQNEIELKELLDTRQKLKDYYLDDYQKNYSIHEREVSTASRRFAAMTKKELEVEANKYKLATYANELIDPNILDELAVAMKLSGVDPRDFDSFRKEIKDNFYDEPWLKNDLGKYLNNQIDVLKTNLDNIVYDFEDEKGITAIPDTIEGILDYLEFTEVEDDNE
jgi:hypothetical protein